MCCFNTFMRQVNVVVLLNEHGEFPIGIWTGELPFILVPELLLDLSPCGEVHLLVTQPPRIIVKVYPLLAHAVLSITANQKVNLLLLTQKYEITTGSLLMYQHLLGTVNFCR